MNISYSIINNKQLHMRQIMFFCAVKQKKRLKFKICKIYNIDQKTFLDITDRSNIVLFSSYHLETYNVIEYVLKNKIGKYKYLRVKDNNNEIAFIFEIIDSTLLLQLL